MSVLRAPAVVALVLQCAAFVATAMLLPLIELGIGSSPGVGVFAAVEGLVACALSYWRRLDSWWLAIQFFFPVALAGTLGLHLPPLLFFILFLIFVALYWSTFRTRVPYYPSNRLVWDAVANLLPQTAPIKFIDIGSGFGGLLFHLAALRNEDEFVGIELAPLPLFVSRLRARWQASRAKFVRGDYAQLDFADFDVVFAYLSPAAMPALWAKAQQEMRPGTLLLSYEFDIPGASPDIVITPGEGSPPLYGWRR